MYEGHWVIKERIDRLHNESAPSHHPSTAAILPSPRADMVDYSVLSLVTLKYKIDSEIGF